MDIHIVNTILRLCSEQQTCLFEVTYLCDYCLEQRICTNSKHVLASIRNYMEIFKISHDRNRIEFYMPFEICRSCNPDNSCQINNGICPKLHVCYDYFYTSSCRRSLNCPYPHSLTQKSHGSTLSTLKNLDLDALTKAFKVYCQSKKYLQNHNSSGMFQTRGAQAIPLLSVNNSLNQSSTSSTNTWRLTNTPQINSNISWKTNQRMTFPSKPVLPTQPQQRVHSFFGKGLQICWTPSQDIQTHFIEVVFSNQDKCDGGPIRTHSLYKHLGIAQLFYQNTDIVDRVVNRGPVIFQSFTFTSRRLQRTIDSRHLCFLNMSINASHIPLYIDTVSMPHKTNHFDFYQDDQQTIVVEYNEDVDYSKISSNVRSHPECGKLSIKCIQLYHPETLLIEYDQEYSECDIKNLFKNERIFHIKTYAHCAFVHFYCHDDLIRSMKTSFNDPIRVTPIYVEIYSQQHLENYLKRRQSEFKSKVISVQNVIPLIMNDEEASSQIESHSTNCQGSETPPNECEPVIEGNISPLKPTEGTIASEENPASNNDDHLNENFINDILGSDDDFHDLPSEFDDDDLLLDETVDSNGDMEFLRSAAKNLMSSLAEMEAASSTANTLDAPHSLLYGDDYVITIKSRRFAIAFLDYTQFRVEKQRNPDKFRLLATLKKQANNNQLNQKKRKDTKQHEEDMPSPTPNIAPDLLLATDTKSTKKKRNKRSKKKKNTPSNTTDTKDKSEAIVESGNDGEDDEDDGTTHVLNKQEYTKNDFPTQRLPHVYLDDDLKPCIFVTGEEHHDEYGHEMFEHDDWHNIVAGGKPVPVSKKSKKRKPQPSVESTEQIIPPTPTVSNPRPQPSATDSNSLIIPSNCRGFLHQPKLYETFRLRLRRSYPSINIHFNPDTYTIVIDGNIKTNVQQCLQYLQTLQTYKHYLSIPHIDFPQTTVTNIVRMQQSTAQVKLIPNADYNRIFRSVYRLIDYQLKQQFAQQQCIYCRRSRNQFRITYLEFSCEKQSTKETDESIQQRVLQLLNTRFNYIAVALSADLLRTKRWGTFYKSLTDHKDINKTLLIRKVDTIIQVYGLHAHVQQIQTLITKFVDVNRYETDVIEIEQANGIFSLFEKDFHEMENLDLFREAELRFIYSQRRHTLFFQCFQDKFETVKNRIEKLRSQLSAIVLPVKSPILSRYYSRSNEIQRMAATSSCIITVEKNTNANRLNDNLVNLKIIGRSTDSLIKAQRLIKDFEEQKYSIRKIHNNDIHLFNDQDSEALQNECGTCNVSYTIDQSNNIIELEGLSGDFIQIEKVIKDLCLGAARRALDDLLYSIQWVYYDTTTGNAVAFGEAIKQQLENCYIQKQKGIVNLRDRSGHAHMFDLDQMIEIIPDRNSSIRMKIERRDLKNPQSVQLPVYWASMTKPWDRILLARRDDANEWKVNAEIQRLLRLQYMLPESWIVEVYRIQNPRIFQQYVAHRESFAARSQATERVLYRLAQDNLVDDVCAHGFNQSHTDSAFSVYGHGCHFYCKAMDIARTATLLANSQQIIPIHIQQQQQQTPTKPSIRFLFVCKVLVGRYTRGEASMKTCPLGYDSLVDNIHSPEVFVTHHDAQVLPEYLIAYHSAIF
ncbi:unnamed protein product [Adineta ricciae]|uniref:Poly [ADP-ribose] polymerase n=1 Tax=Adineta ricciae TaxID=249248 RepID=A0A813MZT2_ADIRI|nr:unnamed protein product [Adineta ricciae]